MANHPKKLTIALAGNPNAGKTTIFNHLTGARQKVGNWSGVTVEKKEGTLNYKDYQITVVDLPGIYSLTAYSIEEVVARNYILEEHPDVVVDILDASNLERNLYLAVQLIELNIPLVFAMNMVDVAKARGIIIDYDQLSRLLGVPIVQTVGTRGEGITELLETVIHVASGKHPTSRHIHINYGKEIEEEIVKIRETLKKDPELYRSYYPRWFALKLLEKDRLVEERARKSPAGEEIMAQVEASRERIQSILGDDPETIIAEARYGFISGALKETMRLSAAAKKTISDKIDQVLTNRLLGFPVFIFFMYFLFQATFTIGAYPVEWIEKGVELLASFVASHMSPGPLRDLLIDGVISGVGGVIVFLPNILMLFLGISLFEDTGYMARAAFIMDRIMHSLGLHGKSFIPLLMGFGCNVPAIMATRTLESRRDRLLTILINPLMSCSARLPVYVLLAGAFFPRRAGDVIFGIYILGVVLAIGVGRVMSMTIFKGESAPFVLELPPYRLPTMKSVFLHMWENTKVYLQKMGGVVLAFSVVIWFLGNYPQDIRYSQDYDKKIKTLKEQIIDISSKTGKEMAAIKRLQEQIKALQRAKEEERLAKSYIGRIGKAIEPVLAPLGFDWKLGVSLVTGVVAKEVVVSTMAVLYQAGEDDTSSLQRALKSSNIDRCTALAFMVFVLIYVPCLVTVVTIWKETGSLGWTFFSVAYLMVLAWITAFLTKMGCCLVF
ncbi:MAG: ferrous iron transport protein B [Thermodesulfobacteria bacterium]|nr:ferrous iron transport protein B [Thermodesulfobacteriota bacterium]